VSILKIKGARAVSAASPALLMITGVVSMVQGNGLRRILGLSRKEMS